MNKYLCFLVVVLIFQVFACEKKQDKTIKLNKTALENCKKAFERVIIIADKQNMYIEFTEEDEQSFQNCVFNYNQKVIDCVMNSKTVKEASKCNLMKINLPF